MISNETRQYFKILGSLSKDAFINKKEITPLLKEYLYSPTLKNDEDIKQYNENLLEFADKIRQAEHIEYNKNYLGKNTDKNGNKCGTLQIYASLTPKGLIFLNQYKDRKAKKRVVFFQIVIAVLTTIFIGLTAIYAYLTYEHDIKKDEVKQSKSKPMQSQKPTANPTIQKKQSFIQ